MVSVASDGALRGGEDLVSACERGVSADVLLLLISPASNPARWVREQWESILFAQAAEAGTRVAVVLLEECVFPALLRRKVKFFDATGDRIRALREIKRWVRGVRLGTEPGMDFSSELEPLYRELADQTGSRAATGAEASRFAVEAARDFEAVLWIPGYGRSLAQVAGELGAQLGMSLDGPLEENCERIRKLLAATRCLVIFDAPDVPVDTLMPEGRASFLFTTEAVRRVQTQNTLGAGRRLVNEGRIAEAYEVLYRVFDSGVDRELCARELGWICDRWERYDEAASLRAHFRLPPSEQMSLFAAA